MSISPPSDNEMLEAVKTMFRWIVRSPKEYYTLSSSLLDGYRNCFRGYLEDPRLVLKPIENKRYNSGQLILFHDIPFISFCEHHFMPFDGHVNIGYIPNDKIFGVGNVVRFVELISSRLYLQEDMTNDIAYNIKDIISPAGVAVLIKAKHTCVMCSKSRSYSAQMSTSCILGSFMSDENRAKEFFYRSRV